MNLVGHVIKSLSIVQYINIWKHFNIKLNCDLNKFERLYSGRFSRDVDGSRFTEP